MYHLMRSVCRQMKECFEHPIVRLPKPKSALHPQVETLRKYDIVTCLDNDSSSRTYKRKFGSHFWHTLKDKPAFIEWFSQPKLLMIVTENPRQLFDHHYVLRPFIPERIWNELISDLKSTYCLYKFYRNIRHLIWKIGSEWGQVIDLHTKNYSMAKELKQEYCRLHRRTISYTNF